ncbi:MAG: hypothetical protein NTZ78_13310 [Candidatus Aureabacteria bacterium]|nr:hypothetical protein [Candidatus Auribacterota bacterium]
MKKMITAALSLLFVVCLSYTAVAGSIDAPGSPSAGSGMYTLQNLYDYIVGGTALEVQTSFQEPSAAPGSTMKSTKQIGDALKTSFEQCPVTAADVKLGVKFFCTQSGSWGVQTGTAQLAPTATPTPTSTPEPTSTPDWYTQYGPSGDDEVVQIGTMYVAKWTNNEGTASGEWMNQGPAVVWATGLVWLNKDDWRIPDITEALTVCGSKDTLGAYPSEMESSTVDPARPDTVSAWVMMTDCSRPWMWNYDAGGRVRVVRTAP